MQLRNAAELIAYKTYADLKAEAARSYLGLMWWIFEPIIYLAAFYVLFVIVMQRGGPDFVPMFLTGAVVWKWFDSGIKTGGKSIAAHSGLMQHVYVPKFIFPIIALLGSTARFIPVFVIFLIFLLWYGYTPTASWWSVPLIITVQFLMIGSLAGLVGAVMPFLPDLRVAIDNGLMMMFFLSGVFFDINQVHEPARSYLMLNPMAVLIDEYRKVLLHGQLPSGSHLLGILLLSAIVGGIALWLLKRLDHRYGKVRF